MCVDVWKVVFPTEDLTSYALLDYGFTWFVFTYDWFVLKWWLI